MPRLGILEGDLAPSWGPSSDYSLIPVKDSWNPIYRYPAPSQGSGPTAPISTANYIRLSPLPGESGLIPPTVKASYPSPSPYSPLQNVQVFPPLTSSGGGITRSFTPVVDDLIQVEDKKSSPLPLLAAAAALIFFLKG